MIVGSEDVLPRYTRRVALRHVPGLDHSNAIVCQLCPEIDMTTSIADSRCSGRFRPLLMRLLPTPTTRRFFLFPVLLPIGCHFSHPGHPANVTRTHGNSHKLKALSLKYRTFHALVKPFMKGKQAPGG